MKNIIFIMLLLAITYGTGCSGNTAQKQNAEEAISAPATGTPEATTQMAYICPMQCEGSASHEPGKCPVCSMDLVKNPNYQATTPDSAAVIN